MLSLDPANGAQSVQFSLSGAYGVSTGKVCDVMPTIFNSGWGELCLSGSLDGSFVILRVDWSV
jgi:hypothetical protein